MIRQLLTIANIFLLLSANAQNLTNCRSFQPSEALSTDATINNRLDRVDTNYGDYEFLVNTGWTGHNVGSIDQDWRSLIRFQAIDTLLSAGSAYNVTLTLFGMASEWFAQEGMNSSRLYLITEEWDEATVTWNTQPYFDTSAYVEIPTQMEGFKSIDIDVTGLVKKLVAERKKNFGFLIKLNNEDPYNSLIFASSNTADTTLRPRLKICKEEEVVTPPDLTCRSFQPSEALSTDATINNRLDRVDTNYGDYEFLVNTGWTGHNVGSIDQDWRSLIRFQAIDTLLSAGSPYNVTLTLYGLASEWFAQEGMNSSRLYLITEEWDEATVTWNTQPSFDTSAYVEIPSQMEGFKSIDIDVTGLVKKLAAERKKNFGFLIKLNNEDPYNSLIFASSNTADTTLRPRLIICMEKEDVLTKIYMPKASIHDLVYPNPAKDKIFISGFSGFSSFLILDGYGITVLQGNVSAKVDISNLNNGMYLLLLNNGTKSVTQKFIKE